MSLRIHALSALHRAAYSASGGRLGKRLVGLPVLLLTTTGRRSGKPRTVPLTYFEDGDDIVLVASYGGGPSNPGWFLNLEAHPQVTVKIGSETRPLQARHATSEERARLWPRVVDGYRGYAAYQRRTAREIPLAVLSPPSGLGDPKSDQAR